MKNKRLEAIAGMVIPGLVSADIGTDHAYLAAELVLSERCEKVYAADVAEGPLKQAEITIKSHGLEGKVIPILSDGIKEIPSDVRQIIIAGMGWETIRTILEQDIQRLPQFKRILVQTNRDVEGLRRWISSHHWTIQAETLVYDRFYYQIVAFDCFQHDAYSEEEILFGPCLMRDRSSLFLKYAQMRLEKIEAVLPHIQETQKKLSHQQQLTILQNIVKERP